MWSKSLEVFDPYEALMETPKLKEPSEGKGKELRQKLSAWFGKS